MIKVKNLTKVYGERKAIDNLSFEIKKGEVVGFLGPNGAGKSTTMKIITGFMAPTSGEAMIGDNDVFENPVAVKKKIGYLPEAPPLYPEMKVKNYLEFVANLKNVPKEKLKVYVDEALSSTQLHDVAHRRIENLSKGFRQRVGIAQALVSKPEVLILDEPTVGLDPNQVAEIRSLINSLKGKHTIIFSTHILSEVQATCERYIIINEGKIISHKSLASKNENTQQVIKVECLEAAVVSDLVVELKSLSFINDVRIEGKSLVIYAEGKAGDIAKVSKLIANSSAGLLSFKIEEDSLEDVFIKLTNKKGDS